MKRQRRSQLLTQLLKDDRPAYIETVSFLNIPRRELPNRQDVPLRTFDPNPRREGSGTQAQDAAAADGLVPDCILVDQPMGENVLEAALLSITRDIYASETGVPHDKSKEGIRGLLAEMRTFMLSPEGVAPVSQQEVLVRTLRTLMTPFLPPFYRIFMGGIVPSYNPEDTRVGADPKWLADAFQWVRDKLPVGKEYLEPGRQLGPWFYAPTLTSVVAPYAFGFLVGPSTLNLRSDGQLGGSSWRNASSCRSRIAKACASIHASSPRSNCSTSWDCRCASAQTLRPRSASGRSGGIAAAGRGPNVAKGLHCGLHKPRGDERAQWRRAYSSSVRVSHDWAHHIPHSFDVFAVAHWPSPASTRSAAQGFCTRGPGRGARLQASQSTICRRSRRLPGGRT